MRLGLRLFTGDKKCTSCSSSSTSSSMGSYGLDRLARKPPDVLRLRRCCCCCCWLASAAWKRTAALGCLASTCGA
uniref:Uncharacterized protein n=1 Tax=Globisporangium ultimum (strain ATCC 200006 / CBS 805.95 / DAOM BR144) TaxID=431595 RepID=K3WQN4_GLOUD